jgi:hypothetical protein
MTDGRQHVIVKLTYGELKMDIKNVLFRAGEQVEILGDFLQSQPSVSEPEKGFLFILTNKTPTSCKFTCK